MLAILIAAVFAFAAPPVLTVVDDDGTPVAGATVRFVAANRSTDVETTGPAGEASPRQGFVATSATVEAPEFARASVVLGGAPVRVVLHRVPAVIGAVRVATGSQSSLHRLPLAASVLDAQALRDTPAATSDALLRDLPGFDRGRSNSAFTNYGQLRVSFAGAGNDRGAVLVDGLPAQDAFGGQVDWAAYPPDNLVRAELLRGAGSALYGSGAVGGVLDLQTRAPQSDARFPGDGALSAGAGGLARSDESLFFRAPLNERVAASLWSSSAWSSYRIAPDGMRSSVDHPARSQSDATQFRVRTTGGAASLEASGLFATDAQDQGRPNYDFGRTLQQGALRYSLAGERTESSLAAYVRQTNVLNVADQFPQKPGVLRYVQHVPAWEDGVFGSWTARAPHLIVDLRADVRGVHGISDQRGGNGALQSLGSGSQTLAGFAVQADARFGRFEALAGARYDDVTFSAGRLVTVSGGKTTFVNAKARDDAAVSPRAALRYDLSPALTLRASSGAGFRAPFLNELVRGFQIGATQFAPNPALIPERARTDGAGIDLLGGHSRLAFDLTRTVVNDAIGFVTITPTLQQRANVARTRTDGALATYTAALGRCTRARLSGQTQYARVLAGPRATLGKRLPYVPDREATLGLDAQAGPVRYGVDASFIGTAYADDLNTQLLNRVLLIGARVAAPLGAGGTLTLSAENLTDRIYLSSIDRLGPPAALTLRATFPLGMRPARAAGAAACAL
ncbi:MAG: TonB-dependent receptor [Candidatus Eremiobacteraeota bacterium]|nr:TonB-dependent receptor [Candidatus Eremiobacteraeota bacterium]